MEVMLSGGPLDGETRRVAEECVQYSTRIDGTRVVYRDSGATTPKAKLRIFTFQEPEP
jgi:hypothetical protein